MRKGVAIFQLYIYLKINRKNQIILNKIMTFKYDI